MRELNKAVKANNHSVIRLFGSSVIGKSRSAFTIVELLVVVAIIGILLGIVSVAANGALRNGRVKRASAMCSVLQQAVSSYCVQKGRWPDTIETRSKNMDGKDAYTFTGEEADKIFQEIVKSSTGANATMSLLDASGLFVVNASRLKNNGEGCYDNHADKTQKTYCGDQNCVNGVDFSVAAKKGKGHIPISSMAFGYPGADAGKFRRYWITYNGRTDSVTVSQENPDKK